MSPVFEAMMLLCFGCSWPFAIRKTWKTKRVEGVSILFLWLVLIGYVAGVLFKLTGTTDAVLLLYAVNFFMVGTEIVLYYRYRQVGVS